MEFKVSHISRVENHYANKLTTLGFENKIKLIWYLVLPPCISLNFFHNRFQFPFVQVLIESVFFFLHEFGVTSPCCVKIFFVNKIFMR